jgi:membrane protein YdbS with pleckstrin-like domain
MQDFENIQSLWQSHSVEVKISSEEMLEQAKKEVNAIRTKSLFNIGGMLLSFIAISAALLYFEFDSWTTNLGIGIIVAAVAIYTVLLYREHRLISRNDFTEHPGAFLGKLHEYQLSRFNLYNRLYWFYVAAVSLGFILFFFETLHNLDTWIQLSIILFTALWMVFCATILRRAFMKKEKERIDLLIEKFERISAQFHELE